MRGIATIAVILATTGHALAAGSRAFTIDDALAIREVSSARLSPDGQWIVYVGTRNDLDADETRDQIFIVSAKGGALIKMTADSYSASDPRWSPDGKYLAFLAARDDIDEDAATEVYTLNLKGGDAERYTDVPQGVEGFERTRKRVLHARTARRRKRGPGLSTAGSSRKTASAISTDRERTFTSSTSATANRSN